MKHTPTPWRASEYFGNIYIETENATPIVKMGCKPADKIIADCEHIVKCVNAYNELMEFVRKAPSMPWAKQMSEQERLIKKYGGKE